MDISNIASLYYARLLYSKIYACILHIGYVCKKQL